MKKKFISIAKKAMVWTMAASMLVATPLTASAQGLSDVFNIQDGWGNDLGENGNKLPADHDPSESHGDWSRTGTVTSTNTNTGYLKSDVAFDGITIVAKDEKDNKFLGDIEFNFEKYTEVKLSAFPTLEENGKVSTLDDPKYSDLRKQLEGKYTWKSSNTSVATFASVATKGKTDEMTLRIRRGGRATITASFDDYTNGIHYADTINVFITQDAERIYFDRDYLKHDAIGGASLDLNEYVRFEPEGATDEVTFALVSSGSNPKHKATLKNGVLKLHAKSEDGEKVQVIAIGTKKRSDVETIEITAAKPAVAAEFKIKGNTIAGNKHSWKINEDGLDVDCEVKLFADKNKKTDSNEKVVSWTSNKPDIVTVKAEPKSLEKNPDGLQAKLKAKSAGTAQIAVKTSTGKSFKVNVTVVADLTDVLLTNGKAYSGQTLQVKATQMFGKYEDFTEAGLKWEFAGTKEQIQAAKKVASIKSSGAYGILTIKPSISYKKGKDYIPVNELYLKATATKKNSKGEKAASKVDMKVDLEQVDIRKIVVFPNTLIKENEDGTVKDSAGIAKATDGNPNGKNDSKNNPIKVAVGDTKTFGLYAEAEGHSGENFAKALGWTVNNAKIAKVAKPNDNAGSMTAIKKGSPSITVSGSMKVGDNKYKAIKVTLKTSVTQPSKTIKITTKNSAITKDKKLTFKVTLDKGSSTNAKKDIEWTVTDQNGNKDTFTNGQKITNSAGDVLIVRARVKETGISTTMKINVVNKTENVELKAIEGQSDVTIDAKGGITVKDNVVTLQALVNDVAAGSKNEIAEVTYTVSKPAAVRLVKEGKDKVIVKPVQEGKFTITVKAVSADGKPSKAVKITFEDISLKSSEASGKYSVE